MISKGAERANELVGPSLESFGIARGTILDVFNALVKDLPSQTAKAMRDRPDSLVMAETRYDAAIQGLESAAFGLDRCVGCLVQDPPHRPVAFRTSIALRYFG